MDDFSSAGLHRSSSSELQAAAVTDVRSPSPPSPAFPTWPDAPLASSPPPLAAAGLPPSSGYVDIDVSQPGDRVCEEEEEAEEEAAALSPREGGVMRVEQRDESDEDAGEGEQPHGDEPRQQRQPYQQQQQTRQPHRAQWPRGPFEPSHAQQQRATDDEQNAGRMARSITATQRSVAARHQALTAAETAGSAAAASGRGSASEEDEEEWARDEEEADLYNDAVLSSRLDSAFTPSAAPSAFSYSTLSSYLPASISTLPHSLSSLPSSLSSSLPASLSSLPSSLSSLPSTLSSLPSHLPSLSSLPSLPALPALPTTTASSSSAAPAPVVTFKTISSFTYASDVYYLLLLATHSSLKLYHIDSNAQAVQASQSSAIAVKRISSYADDGMAYLSSCCFLTPSVSLLSSPDLLLPTPLTPPGHLGPLLALTSNSPHAQSAFPSSAVRIYSAFLSKPVHLLRFRSRVLRVVASTHTFAVLLESEVVVYATPQSCHVDELRFDLLYSLRCATGSGSEYGVCALGPRWIAYASDSAPSGNGAASGGKSGAGENSPLLLATSTTPKLAPSSGSPFALPPSASSSSLSSPSAAAASLLSSLPSSSDSLSTISRNIASSLYNLGDQGRRSLSNYLTPLPAESVSASSLPTAAHSPPASTSLSSSSGVSSASPVGVVVVRDVLSQRVLCHLKAHSSAIAALAFDPTGTLLVTAGQHGQYIHIYQLVTLPPSHSSTSAHSSPPQPSASPSSVSGMALTPFSPRFLYRLFRGVTHATLRSLTFSSDSNWFACTSQKGTTHIFAINPHGGPVNVSTHAPPPVQLHDDRDEREEDGVGGHPLTLNAIHRVRGNFPSSPTTSPVTSSFLQLSLPSSSPSHIDHLALLTSTAEVLLYRLSTVYRPPPPTASNSLALLSSAQQHRRRKETVVGESDSLQQMVGGVVEGVGVVMGHVVHEVSKAVRQGYDNYQSGHSAAQPVADSATVASEDANQRKLDLVVTAVAHLHLATDATEADGGDGSGRRGRDSDGSGGGGSGGSGGSGGGRDRRVTSNPNFFRDIEQRRHTQLTRSSGQSAQSAQSTQAASAWLANVELRPYSSQEPPLWASPQFTLCTYDTPSPTRSAQSAVGVGPRARSSAAAPSPLSSAGALDELPWYAEPRVTALQYDKWAGQSSVGAFDGSSLGYTEVKLETEPLVEQSEAYSPQQPPRHHQPAQYQPLHKPWHEVGAGSEASSYTARTAAVRTYSSAEVQSGAERAEGGMRRSAGSASGRKQLSHPLDEHKAAADPGGASGVSELLTRRVSRFVASDAGRYSPPQSASSHRSLSPSASSDRDSDEQLVM